MPTALRTMCARELSQKVRRLFSVSFIRRIFSATFFVRINKRTRFNLPAILTVFYSFAIHPKKKCVAVSLNCSTFLLLFLFFYVESSLALEIDQLRAISNDCTLAWRKANEIKNTTENIEVRWEESKCVNESKNTRTHSVYETSLSIYHETILQLNEKHRQSRNGTEH